MYYNKKFGFEKNKIIDPAYFEDYDFFQDEKMNNFWLLKETGVQWTFRGLCYGDKV